MHIAIVTAGGAGMFCGSCMLDNTLARALMQLGHEATLIPTYTPIRTDEDSVSSSRVFFGGINVYLDSRVGFWKRLPAWLVRGLNHPRLIQLATRFSVSNDAHDLGSLTVEMLQGTHGPQRREVEELVRYLTTELRPDVILFSNALISGVMPMLREQFPGPVFCMLQGDDIFLDDLLEPWASRAMDLIRSHTAHFDGLVVHSEFYRTHMATYLNQPPGAFHVVRPGISVEHHDGQPRPAGRPFTVGYFARVCPEKGFDQVVAGFREFHTSHPNSRLLTAGYLGKRDQPFFDRVMARAADLGDALQYLGSPPDLVSKVKFYKQLDVLSVPTVYHEPKGLYVLEALANGVPVVVPAHGAFPELVKDTQGGLLFEPGSVQGLADALRRLADDPDHRLTLAKTGHQAVHDRYHAQRMAQDLVEVLSNTHGPRSTESGSSQVTPTEADT